MAPREQPPGHRNRKELLRARSFLGRPLKTFQRSNVIYLDHHATTPMDPRVLEAMVPYFVHRFANAASFTHSPGRDADGRVRKARAGIAGLIGAKPDEIVFTSGATESNNLALKGAARAYREKGDHVVTAASEHKSVLDPCKRLATEGFRVTVLPVDAEGFVDPAELEKAMTPETILVSVMMANNETGTVQPVEALARIAKKRGAIFHCDATQAVGKIPFDVRKTGADLVSFTAHKIYGPKGVGALYVRKSGDPVRLVPLIDGGGHEVGMRSGTLNVPGIVGFAKACELCRRHGAQESKKLARLRDRLRAKLLRALPEAVVHGPSEKRLPNNLSISFPGLEARALLARLPGLALSSGSACTSTSVEPSYVLKAMGVPEPLRRSSVRFGLGRFNTEAEIDKAVTLIAKAVKNASL